MLSNAVSIWVITRRALHILLALTVAGALLVLAMTWWHHRQIALDTRTAPSLPFPIQPLKESPFYLAKVATPTGFNRITCLNPWPENGLLASQQDGIVWQLDEQAPEKSRIVLDIKARTFSHGESGFFGIAAHPRFSDPESPGHHRAYLFYCAKKSATTNSNRLSQFTWDPLGKCFDAASEVILIEQDDRHDWHNGGSLVFGLDGFLYVSLGDEGGIWDAYENSQKIDKNLFSGVLRLDVDCRGGAISHPIKNHPLAGQTAKYFIPSDNPWCGKPGALEEFYAIGLRNPHNLFINQVSGDIYLTDVGQSGREELNKLSKGANFGWAWTEGEISNGKGPQKGVPPSPLIGEYAPPLLAYPHTEGNICIIGGTVYTGEVFPQLRGKILIGDLGSGRLWSWGLPDEAGKPAQQELITAVVSNESRSLVGIATTTAGEVLVVTYRGELFRLTRREAIDRSGELPGKLSETGLFKSLATLTPNPGVLPYEINSPLWSDGAHKMRWMAIPGDGTNPSVKDDRIIYSKKDRWSFPAGSTFIKHFELPIDLDDPTKVKRLETRVMVRDTGGGVWGVTYRWNADDTDAFLLPAEGLTENIVVRKGQSVHHTTAWSYPSRDDCISCHNGATGGILGLSTAQLNRSITYAETGRHGDQIRSLNAVGYLSRENDIIKPIRMQSFFTLDRMASPSDARASLNDRVDAYFASNCSHCHRPGYLRLDMDLRYHVPMADRSIIGVDAEMSFMGKDRKRVVPQHPEHSEIFMRMTNLELGIHMPPLGTSVVDEAGTALVADWIRSLPSPPAEK